MNPGAYQPFEPARRPGSRPAERPSYRVLVHHRLRERWAALPGRVGLENAQQFWDHVATNPGQPASVGSTSILRGKAGQPRAPGFSRTIHYEITGAGRIDLQFANTFKTKDGADPHPVVFILSINLSSH